jgi:outer membrane receptor protein involved in Fe transport
MNLINDDRSDDLYSIYGQVEYKLIPQLRVVGALRWDDGDLFDRQFSPKGALVFSPDENNSFRFSVNKAFQTPNYSEFFLQVPVAAPSTGPGTLQATIQGYYQQIAASPLAPTLTGLTTTLPWNFVGAQGIVPTPALALGNANLKVEKVTGWELGYKGSLSQNAYVTIDGYINQLKDFVTDLLPGVNQTQYPSYALDDEVDLPAELATLDGRLAGAGLPANHPLRAAIPQLLAGYGAVQAGTRIGGANALATLPDGSRAIVLSYTNAGKVTERGVEVGLGYQLTPEFRSDVTFTGFDFTVKSQAVGDQLVPNTPSKKASASLSYAGQQGVDANVTVRLVDGYQWAAGVFQGYVPSNEFVNVSAGYRVNNYFRIHATATNLFDQKRFQLYGGSVIGRRVLGGITAAF